jgi:hypothetical protein
MKTLAGKNKAYSLAYQALSKPELIEPLSEDEFIKFVISIGKYDTKLATRVLELKQGKLSSQTKIKFWEKVGILIPLLEY